MATTTREVMNHELFVVRPSDPADDTLATLLAMRLGAAPVIDERGGAKGVIALRDLVSVKEGESVSSRMSAPAVTVRDDSSIESAARILAEAGLHHAPVVDRDGVVVGFLSLLDVVRGLVGMPARHPPGFPHYDEDTDLIWTDAMPLSEKYIDAAPDAAGVLALVRGGRNLPETVVRAEATNSLRSHLVAILSEPLRPSDLERWLDRGELWFRAAAVASAEKRESVVRKLEARAHALWRPRA